jgi:F0F1-type ATP synthase assembly protein I
MKRDPAPGREMGEGYRLVALGMNFAGGVIIFALAGLWLDRRLGSIPAFTIGGTLLGLVLSFLNIYWKLAAYEKRHREEQEKGQR